MSILKNVRNRVLPALFVSVLLLSLRLEPAGACSCVQPGSVAEEFAESDAVFIGSVVARRPVLLAGLGPGTAVTFEVEESWKGVTGQTVEVKTDSIYGTCGVWVSDGDRLIVFADDGSGEDLFMNACSLTSSDSEFIERARAEIAATGAQPIELSPGPDPQFAPSFVVPMCGAGAPGAVGAMLLPLWLLGGRHTRRGH
jgi:hypothetical protein